MKKHFTSKMEAILEEFKVTPVFKVAEFDKRCKAEGKFSDATGAVWNKYMHKNCLKYMFEVWKEKKGPNYFVDANDEARAEAVALKLIPTTNAELYRGEKRK